MGALDQLRGANGDGVNDRARSNPWLVVAIAAAAILLLAWIGWAIHVTSKNGAGAGLGVVIAWPAMLAGLTLVSLPFVGGYLLVRRLSDGEESTAEAGSAEDEAEDEESEDAAEDETPAEDEGQDEGSDEDEASEPEPESSKAG